MNSASTLSSGHSIGEAASLYATSPSERAGREVARVLAEAQALPFPLPDAFRAHVETMTGALGDEAAARLRGADVGLAWACAQGLPAALATFDAVHLADLRAVHARARGDKPPFDEFAQTMRTKLFVGDAPRIAEYRGVGALKSWLRVVATRALIESARRAKRTEPLDRSGVLPLEAPDDDPEMAYLKRRYAMDIKAAFEEASRRLDAEERNVLRAHYAGGLGIDQIAAAHGIHRATAARRLVAAREAVLSATRQILAERLRLSRGELESMVRLVQSQMHVTVERVFAP